MQSVRGDSSLLPSTHEDSFSPALTSLLSLSSTGHGLIRCSSSDFDAWSQQEEREYALVVFLTASAPGAGCAVCERISTHFERIARGYEQARYLLPSVSSTSPSPSPSPASFPLHHVFFLSLDASTASRSFFSPSQGTHGRGRNQAPQPNLPWFRSHNITRVPEVVLLRHSTTPAPEDKVQGAQGDLDLNQDHDDELERDYEVDDSEHPESDSSGSPVFSPGIVASRLALLRARVATRWALRDAQTLRALSQAGSKGNEREEEGRGQQGEQREDEEKRQSDKTNSTATAATSTVNSTTPSSQPSPPSIPPPTPTPTPTPARVSNYRNVSQSVSFPASALFASTLSAQSMAEWVVLHTRTRTRFQTKTSKSKSKKMGKAPTGEVGRRPLPPGLVRPLHDLDLTLPSFVPLRPTPAQETWYASFFARVRAAFAPFTGSILLALTLGFFVHQGVLTLCVLPATFFLWNATGSMNNVIKQMPLIGMSAQGGPLFFYPGHGSFVGESILMGLLYAYAAFAILVLNLMPLWEVRRTTYPARRNKVADAATPLELTEASERNDPMDPVDPIITPAASPSVSLSGSIRPSSVAASTAAIAARDRTAAARSRAAADETFFDPPILWILFFTLSLHFAFSLMRTVYTQKNPRYNYGWH